MMRVLHFAVFIFAFPSIILSGVLIYDLASIPFLSPKKASIVEKQYKPSSGRRDFPHYNIKIKTGKGLVITSSVSNNFYCKLQVEDLVEVKYTPLSKSVTTITLEKGEDTDKKYYSYNPFFIFLVSLIFLYPLYSIIKLHRDEFYKPNFLIKIIAIEGFSILVWSILLKSS